MAKNTEIELKLLISRADLKKMLAWDFVAQALRPESCHKRRLVSSYYDTEDLAFKQQGIAYRVRDKGDGTFEATVKATLKNSGGLSERLELNLPLPKNQPVLEGFADLGLGYELSELAPEGVSKLFTVNVERTTYLLDLDGAVAELAVDKGKISAGKNIDKIDEIEIELLEGDTGALLAFAAKLAAYVPLFVEKRSKYARGLALRGIAGEMAAPKFKMAQGPVKDELLGALQQHGDILLDAQNRLRQGDASDRVVKEVRRQLLYLRSYGAVAAVLTDGAADGANLLQQCLQGAERLRGLRNLQQLWSKLAQEGAPVLGRTSLGKRIGAAALAAEEALRKQAEAGAMTALYYQLLSWLYNNQWDEDTCVNMDRAARCCLKEWQQASAENISAEKALELADNTVMLCRSMQGKFFAKMGASCKKARRTWQKQAEAALWLQNLQNIAEAGTSKVLHRDVGVVYGWLLAQGGK